MTSSTKGPNPNGVAKYSSQTRSDSPRPGDINILLVDDRTENLIALEAVLDELAKSESEHENTHIRFVWATSGLDALRQLLQAEFAVILLDVQMPGMDGFDTAALIRARPRSRHTPIIFLTAINKSDRNVFHGYSLGAVDYLFKPYDPQVLRAKVGVFIDLFRKKLEIQRMVDESRSQAALLKTSNEELARTNQAMTSLNRQLGQSTEELKKLNEDLERRVASRTRELRETNDALRAAKETAELANNAKDHFLAVLSHELRTPLTPVLAIVQMLDEDPAISDDIRSWMQTIGRNIQLEARLIDDLLDLTRITNGKLQLHLEPVELHKIVHETVAICKEDIRAKNLYLEVHLDAAQTISQADPARIQQVLWNLVKNAVKFTPAGGKIVIRTLNIESGLVRCQVTDSGIGISKEKLSRIFNAFDQGDTIITKRFGGLGLGLTISKALVDQHGGVIYGESAGENKGATFTIELPVVSMKPTSLDSPQANPARPEKKSKLLIESDTKVMLVEDNSDTSHALQILLERKGFTVLTAHSVQSAVDIAKTYPCDLVISDIGLPDGTGHEVMKLLNQIRPTRGIAMSGFGMEEDIQRSLASGFNAHLVKPINFDHLSEILQHLLTPVA